MILMILLDDMDMGQYLVRHPVGRSVAVNETPLMQGPLKTQNFVGGLGIVSGAQA